MFGERAGADTGLGGRLVHDFGRTSARNLERGGVSWSVALRERSERHPRVVVPVRERTGNVGQSQRCRREQDQNILLDKDRIRWCRGRESNPHGPCGPADFKSAASPSSATPA